MKIGVCLCGGGARGIAHIGVLQALEEHNITIEAISGASMGAIVGSLYASGKRPLEILEIVESAKLYKLVSWHVPINGLVELAYLKKLIAKNISSDNFNSLQKKMYVAISNLHTGQCEIIGSGSLFDTVIASASIPLVFKPIKLGNYSYVDGGLLNNLPVEPLIESCDFTIGVNVNANVISDNEKWNMWDIATRSFDLIMWNNVIENLKKCDFVIETPQTVNHHVFDFAEAKKIYEYGYRNTLLQIETLKKSIQNKKQ